MYFQYYDRKQKKYHIIIWCILLLLAVGSQAEPAGDLVASAIREGGEALVKR